MDMEGVMGKIVAVEARSAAPPKECMASVVERFLGAQDVASSSKATYRRQLRQFVAWLHETGRGERMSSFARDDVMAFKERLVRSGKSAYTVSGYLTVVRKLFEWLEAEKVYP